MKEIHLIKPIKKYESQVMNYREIFIQKDERIHGSGELEDVQSFDEWVDFEGRLSKKFGESYVPSNVYLAIRDEDNKLVGMIDFREELTEFLYKYGGNIGYSILPEERRKGYGKEMLKLVLEKCREFGKEKILITCDKDNIASARTIMANGGILENEVADEPGIGESGIIQRYWIKL